MTKRTKVTLITIFLLSFVCFLTAVAYAAVPHLINFQGKLTDPSTGYPLTGSYNITFRIYDAKTAGNLLWQATHKGVVVQKGVFSVLLGSISDENYNFNNLAFDKPYWLAIKVGTDTEMTPRQRITSAGYAIRAEKAEVAEEAENADKVDGADVGTGANNIVQLDGSAKLPAVDGSQLRGVWNHDGSKVFSGNSPSTYTDLDLSSYVGSNRALVFLQVINNGSQTYFEFRTNGDTESFTEASDGNSGTSATRLDANTAAYLTVETDAGGIVEWKGANQPACKIYLKGYIK